MTYTLHHGDCLDILPTLADRSVDLIFFDPPYGIGIADWDAAFDAELVRRAAELCLSKLAVGASLYATCSLHILPAMMGMLPYRRIIPWCKPNLPLRKNLNDWEWSTEFVLWITNGEPRVFNKPYGEGSRDYWRIPVENGFLNPDQDCHPARKPKALLKRIISASSVPDDLVVDPFFGSCVTGEVCFSTGRRFIGIEREQTYYDIAARRLDAAAARMVQMELAV